MYLKKPVGSLTGIGCADLWLLIHAFLLRTDVLLGLIRGSGGFQDLLSQISENDSVRG